MKETRQYKRERILEAAFRIFIEQGYARAKMSAIAKRAGFGKSTLYDYFESKDEIFEEILQTKLVDPYFALSSVVETQASAAERLRAFLTAEIEWFLEYNRDGGLLPTVMTNPEFIVSPILRKLICSVLEYKFRLVRRLVEEGMASGEFRAEDPDISAIRIIGASNAFSAAVSNSVRYGYGAERLPGISYDETARESFFSGLFHGLLP
ncbi:MAG: TetR/AcrR family transcriptional regulator [Clostridiales Family XIII bacterium]|jgi:TetR/AcrR family fatty acid metabolism transcriptional regulator|nr:TetR/AcrR family transcriptional regulator [Clostridiales Family XIII bacterium]